MWSALKSPKTKTLADGLAKKTLSIADEIESKAMYKHEEEKEVRQSEVKPVKNITKNLHSFLEISIVQIKVLASDKLWDHADK